MIRLLAVPLSVAAVTLPMVSGPLPGKHVSLSSAAQAAGAVEVHQVAVTGSGAQRVPLLVGRTADDRLCVGSGTFFRCLRPEDAEPVYVIGAFGGARATRWGSLVGLAGPEVSRVAVELQQGEKTVLPLRRLSGFAWRAFVFPPTGPNGRLPYTLNVTARAGRTIPVDMAFAAPPRRARSVGDSTEAPVGEVRLQMEQAKRLALADPRVRRLLGTTTRLVQAPARWTSCGRKFIGAGIDVLLFRPVAVNDDLPFTAFSPAKRDRQYAEGVLRIHATGVTELLVQVDLNRGKVVDISPGGENIKTAEWKVVKAPSPAGSHDLTTCSQGD